MAGRVEQPLPPASKVATAAVRGDMPKEGEETVLSVPKDEAAAVGGAMPEAGKGANAMLIDMPDETDAALLKRKAIQQVMKDGSLSGPERSKKIQDIMAGRVEQPLPPASKGATAAVRGDMPKEGEETVWSVPKDEAAAVGGAMAEAGKGANAMLTDMPDEADTALMKRRAIQRVMKDGSLSSAERSKKISDIMAARAEQSLSPKEAALPPASKVASGVVQEHVAERKDKDTSLLTVPDDTDAALVKRRAIQQVMTDGSLSGPERSKKIQDIMAEKSGLLPLASEDLSMKRDGVKEEKEANAMLTFDSASEDESRAKSEEESEEERKEDREKESEAEESSSFYSTTTYSDSQQSSSSFSGENNNIARADTSAAEDARDAEEGDKANHIQQVMKDEFLSVQERTKMIHEMIAQRVSLPPPPPSTKALTEELNVKDDPSIASENRREPSAGVSQLKNVGKLSSFGVDRDEVSPKALCCSPCAVM